MSITADALHEVFKAHKKECDEDRISIKADLKSKINGSDVKAFMGVMITVHAAILGYIVYQNADLSNKMYAISISTAVSQSDIATIKKKLEPYDVEFNK